jgi:hypothetical protein
MTTGPFTKYEDQSSSAIGLESVANGVSDAREITRAALEKIAAHLAGFAAALDADEIDQGQTKHCLVVAGDIGAGYGREHEERTEEAVVRCCRAHFSEPARDGSAPYYPRKPKLETAHLILVSNGGSLDSAYKSIVFLRRFVQNIHVYVPTKAKSAATLMAIGADKIFMSPFGELGPLDSQIDDPRNPSRPISALDCYKSVDYVREFGLWTINRALERLQADTQTMVTPSELVSTANAFALGAIQPMLAQVTALDFGSWGRTLRIGENYAQALLSRLRSEDSERLAASIAEILVYRYTHHPYPIDLDEAIKIGLTADMMPERTFAAANDVAEACNGYRFVGFVEDAQDAAQQRTQREQQILSVTKVAVEATDPRHRDGPQASVWSPEEPHWKGWTWRWRKD